MEYFNDPNSYPINCWIPFLVTKQWIFVAIFVYQVIALNCIGLIYASIDSFMFGTIYAAGGQIEILKLSLLKTESFLETEENGENCITIIKNDVFFKFL